MEPNFFGFFATFATVMLAVSGALIVRRFVKIEELRKHHDVADPLLSVVGTLFAVLLGFLVAGASDRFEELRSNVQEEGASIMDVFRMSYGLPDTVGATLRKDCMNYVDAVIDHEWGMMKKGEYSRKASLYHDEMWMNCIKYEPQTQGQSNIHASLLQSIESMGKYRRFRLGMVLNSMPPLLQFTIAVGALATIAFTYFFGIENLKVQIIMTSIVAILLALNVILLVRFTNPFQHTESMRPLVFLADKELFRVLIERHGLEHQLPLRPVE